MMPTFNFSTALLDWFDQHGRKDLPWQQQPSAYHVWLSEIMLQQTQVSTVIPYYQRFIGRFPDLASLAAASQDDVLTLWAGLGYYARGRNLHRAAQTVMQQFAGQLPADLDALISLPGVGRSTAGAIMALAFQQRYPILDGNVKRVLARYFAVDGWPGKTEVERQLWQLAEQLLPEQRIGAYIQAQMDLGATVCTRSKPDCPHCPLQSNCQAYARNQVARYPTAKPAKQLPVKQVYWLILQNQQQQILLQQRPASGIWGGLWCFPEAERLELLAPVSEAHGFQSLRQQTLSAIQHSFSHYKLAISPEWHAGYQQQTAIADKPEHIWVKMEAALQLALPAPVKALIQTL